MAQAAFINELRIRQAEILVREEIIELPEWMPTIVDPKISAIPFLSVVEVHSIDRVYVGWIHIQDGSTRSKRWELCRLSKDLEATHHSLSPRQLNTIVDLIAELKRNATLRQLEGWE